MWCEKWLKKENNYILMERILNMDPKESSLVAMRQKNILGLRVLKRTGASKEKIKKFLEGARARELVAKMSDQRLIEARRNAAKKRTLLRRK